MKLAALHAKLNQPDQVPSGYKTTQQWATSWGISLAHAGKLLLAAKAKGMIESLKLKVMTEGRGVFPTPFFKFKK